MQPIASTDGQNVRHDRYGLVAACRAAGIRAPEPEYRFCEGRKWRFDYAWPAYRLALEVQGGVWMRAGGHLRGGMVRDHEKFTRAAILGWRIIYCQPRAARSLDVLRDIKDALYGMEK